MSASGIQGMPLEVTVVGCLNLKDKEWMSRQDPYVTVEYGGAKHRTRTCTDGGKNPTFQEKFVLTLIEGLREIIVTVWNSNALSADDFIGNGRIQLQKVLSQGFDDSSWTVQDKCGRYAGEVRLILHYSYANSNQAGKTLQAPGQPYATPTAPPYPAYPAAPTYSTAPAYPPSAYPTYPLAYLQPPPATAVYPPPVAAPVYPPPPPSVYTACTPSTWTPQYPPPTHHTSVYPPAGVYPPPPYGHY